WEVVGALNYDTAHARNFCAAHFKGDWLWFIDDDHTFQPDVLERLLAHQVDIVGPLCPRRRSPFTPVPTVDDVPVELSKPGLGVVTATGTAGLLVRRGVFDALDAPWFQHGSKQDGTHVSDDTYFCRQARAAGFDVHVDTSVQLTHLNVVDIGFAYRDGEWCRELTVGGMTVRLPGAK